MAIEGVGAAVETRQLGGVDSFEVSTVETSRAKEERTVGCRMGQLQASLVCAAVGDRLEAVGDGWGLTVEIRQLNWRCSGS